MNGNDRPRGSRRRGKEVIRLNASVSTNVIGERLYKTLVLSDSGDIYEYKRLTKRVCGAIFDWSASWVCTGNKGPISSNQWFEAMKAKGWTMPIQEEPHLKPILRMGGPAEARKHRRKHNKPIEKKLTGRFNPEIGKILPSRIIDFIRLGESRSLKTAFNKLEKEQEGNE